jgi:HAD superfamily hydrolase (TIGR01484 family)
MGKFDGMLICSDFDGTLFSGNEISKENVKAIRYFQKNGGYFTITSGRYPAFLGGYRDRVEANTYLIGLNGTIISNYDGSFVLRQGFLHSDACEIVKKIVREVEGLSALSFSTTKIPNFVKKQCEYSENEGYFRLHFKDWSWELFDLALSCDIHRIIFHTTEPASDAITNQIRMIAGEDYAISRSYTRGIEIQDVAHTKGRSARYLADFLGVHTLICVGDYENDISMIKEADIGCVVANAIPPLLGIADRILPSVDQNPFAELIASL